jgi:hypothetical protein
LDMLLSITSLISIKIYINFDFPKLSEFLK